MKKIATEGLTHAQKTVQLVQAADELAKQASAAAATNERVKAACASLIPDVVNAMIAGDHIHDTPTERAKLAQLLADPVEALDILREVAARPAASALSLGHGQGASPPKQASRASEYDTATQALFESFGISVR